MVSVKYRIYLKGKEIQSIQDIRDNFQIYELMDLMNSGRLRQWLEINGYKDYSDKLSIWTNTDKTKKKRKLYDVFEVPYDDAAEYNITDKLLDDKEKCKRELIFLYDRCYREYSNECFKRDLEYIRDDIRTSENPLIICLEGGFDAYDIPFDIKNVHYIGYCGAGNFLPTVKLMDAVEKYSEKNITFENVVVTIEKTDVMGDK